MRCRPNRSATLWAVILLLGLWALAPLSTAAPRRSPCVVPGAREPLDRIWRPDMRAALAFARGRAGDIAFAVRTDRAFYAHRPDHQEWSASVLKAMLMVAYLDQRSVSHRNLNGYDRSLLVPMITHSDDNAAGIVDAIVGDGGLRALANRVGMSHFIPMSTPAGPWGTSRITPRDQTKFFLHIDRYVAPLHRAFAMSLLASITPSQRWGIGEVAPHGWHLYFKGGWGAGTGLLDHQVVLLTRGCARVSLAVLSMYDGSHDYGKATLRGMFSRLLRRFPTGAPLYPVVQGARYAGAAASSTTASSTVGTVTFQVGRGGQRLYRFLLSLRAAPAGPVPACPVLPVPSQFPIGTVGADPLGSFSRDVIVGPRANAAPAYRLQVTGRFLRHRSAAGTILLQPVLAGPQNSTCLVRLRFSVRAARR